MAGLSTILFPFSVKLVEDFALKYTEREFWVTGFSPKPLPKQVCMQSFICLVICFQFPWGWFLFYKYGKAS
ncbi:colicin E1 family microcin immunity protein [Pseudomonas aeruginosa]|uniref:colicin E1 family microcin immunity protein n=1 Tax=Pseudomonas aeruginosa TaxID=287 RepID=UPI003977C955